MFDLCSPGSPTSDHAASSAPQVQAHSTPTRRERIFHRFREIRQREEVSLRTLARRLKLNPLEVKQQEEDPDPRLSTLHAWAEALEVPLAELAADAPHVVTERILLRAKLLQMMKVVRTIEAWTRHKRIQRLASFLVEQMLIIMPELYDVGPLPTGAKTGQRTPVDPARRAGGAWTSPNGRWQD